jgi:hypothetical protein
MSLLVLVVDDEPDVEALAVSSCAIAIGSHVVPTLPLLSGRVAAVTDYRSCAAAQWRALRSS